MEAITLQHAQQAALACLAVRHGCNPGLWPLSRTKRHTHPDSLHSAQHQTLFIFSGLAKTPNRIQIFLKLLSHLYRILTSSASDCFSGPFLRASLIRVYLTGCEHKADLAEKNCELVTLGRPPSQDFVVSPHMTPRSLTTSCLVHWALLCTRVTKHRFVCTTQTFTYICMYEVRYMFSFVCH